MQLFNVYSLYRNRAPSVTSAELRREIIKTELEQVTKSELNNGEQKGTQIKKKGDSDQEKFSDKVFLSKS